ncbi:MAG TPA: 50S ribosomal protein L25 [candidate division Zixibacteria bacterium]|nr:50S ribosomal protein L25 [candidate division Zixibacteria bacterium]
MKEVVLPAAARTTTGKSDLRQIREKGLIPAVIYGPERDPLSVEVNEREFRTAVKEARGTSSLFDLKVDGKVNKVLIREIQRDPVTNRVMHVDFHAVPMNKPIHVSVPIHIVGTPIGVKTEGGILQHTLRELEIACLPADIPDRIDVDVSALGIGDSLHVKNIQVPNARIIAEERRTVVVVAAPTVVKVEPTEAELAAAAEAEGAEGAEEGEGKEQEEGEAKKEPKKEAKKE